MSKRLALVIFSAVPEGESKAPLYLSGLSVEEKMKKEAEVFDRAISELCSVHWKDAEFDTFKIHSIPIRCKDPSPSDHYLVYKFMKSSLSKMGEYSSLYEETKFMLAHTQRHRNELVFLKCLKQSCTYCMANPPKATKVYAFLQERNMTLFSPIPSNEYTGHYCSFLEMCKKPASELTSFDAGMPSAKSDLGYCPHCPAYVFFCLKRKNNIPSAVSSNTAQVC